MSTPGKPLRILMVDDDRMLLSLYQLAVGVRQSEFELVTAENVEEADKLVRSPKPDVILLDLILGNRPDTSNDELDKANGFNFLLMLKNDPETTEIPVVIFSNLSSQSDKDKARALGAADYLVKARMLPDEVLTALHQAVQLEEARRKVNNLRNGR
jgi:CheY-like chemotaxis protein